MIQSQGQRTNAVLFASDLPGLNPALDHLRDAALAYAGPYAVSALPVLDAEAWQQRAAHEDWLVWRGRRAALRLAAMPIDITPGELIVGRPSLEPATPEEQKRIDESRVILSDMPPFPGGDSGHFHPDYQKLFKIGIGGISREIEERRAECKDPEKRAFYDACALAASGFSAYVRNVAAACAAVSGQEELAAAVLRLAIQPPNTFHEAIELMFLTMIALWFGEDHPLTAPGRMDQTLRPFFEADLAAGRIDAAGAFDLICCLFIQCNMILGRGSAISVLVGGRDSLGRDATNGLTYLCLAARTATRLVYPTVGLAWHEGTPSELTELACRMLVTGIGDPAFFNDELIVNGLRDHGVSEEDSYGYMNSTCVEIKVAGSSNMWVTAPYFNCPKALLELMEEVARSHGSEPATFVQLKEKVKARLAATVAGEARRLDGIWDLRGRTGCFPLASCLVNDCLARGMDFDRGGARYNWVENSFVGLANLADGLVAIDRLVYRTHELTLQSFFEILREDFQGNEPLRARIANRLPCYGTDEEEPDLIAVEMAEFLMETTGSNRVGPHRYVPGFFCWIMHDSLGATTGATPDGRRAGFPLADGAGASQGREKRGPTASILSTTKWNHRAALGGLVHNVKFARSTFQSTEDLRALGNLIVTYLRRGGFELQVNVVDATTLREAQVNPIPYRDLLVRVAGYSDYFVHIGAKLQEEVILRTEHTLR